MKLIDAVEKNDLELVKKLIEEGYSLNEKDSYGWTALIKASCHGYIEIVKELIKAGVPLNNKTMNGDTALLWSSYKGHMEIVKELIKAGASLTEKNNHHKTALYYNKKQWQSFEIQDLILSMYPRLFSVLEEKVGIHKDILLKLKMEQILNL